MHKNFLIVVGITLLFMGLAIQPSIAVNPISIDSEEDCYICPKVSSLQVVRLKSLINRVETLDNKLSVMSKLNPIVAEEYQELSDRITALKELNKELNLDAQIKDKIICAILEIIIAPFMIILDIFTKILNYESVNIISAIGSFILLVMIYPFAMISLPIFLTIAFYGAMIHECWDLGSWPWWEYA